MKFRFLALIVVIAVGLVAQASASTEYYLVGLRHVYMFDVWPDPYKLDRQAIEEDFSGALQAAQQQYDTDMASIHSEEAQDNGLIHQVDRDAVQQNLEQDIAEAADTRDNNLSQLYVQCDYVRDAHPEFAVDQDGAYEVMELEVDQDGEYEQVTFHRPYPLYLGDCPFGWTYGHGFPFFSLGMRVRMAHSHWKTIGSPVFTTVYHAREKVILLVPVRLDVIMSRKAWAGGRPPAVTESDRKIMTQSKNLQRQAGIRPPLAHPGQHLARTIAPASVEASRYSKKPSAPRTEPETTSRFSHDSSRPTPNHASGPEPGRPRGNNNGPQGEPERGSSRNGPPKGGSGNSGESNDDKSKKKGG